MNRLRRKIRKKILRRIDLGKAVKPRNATDFVTVFSHPRSETHLAEAFLARNFYEKTEFATTDIEWKHWSNRMVETKSNKYHKLFGSHICPDKRLTNIDYPVLYIYRDGRAVAYSIWKTENFIHLKHKGVPFTVFLRLKLDWKGSPGTKSFPEYNIVQHWVQHVLGWMELAKSNENIRIGSSALM